MDRVPNIRVKLLQIVFVLFLWVAGAIGQHLESVRERLTAAADSVRRERARHPYPFRDQKVFDVESPETIAGAGFLVQDGEKIFAVTAGHPFPTSKPTKFTDGDREIALAREVANTSDVLWFAVDPTTNSIFRLVAQPGRILRENDAIAVVCHDGVREGKLSGFELGVDHMLLPGQPVRRELEFKVPGPNDFAGNSGAPVILEETGEVIGVLMGAIELSKETLLRFTPLPMTASNSLQVAAPKTFFGLIPRGRSSGVAARIPPGILPPDLFEILPNTPIADLLAVRPYLPGKSSPAFRGLDYGEVLGFNFIFSSATFSTVKGNLIELELWGSDFRQEISAARVEAMFDWFFDNLGKPDDAFCLVKYHDKPGVGSVFCRWKDTQAEVTLGAYVYKPGCIEFRLIAVAPGVPTLDMPSFTSLPATIPSLQVAVRKMASAANAR